MEDPDKTTVFNIKETQHFIKDAVEKDCIIRSLQHNNGNILLSARQLGLARPTLHRKMKKHGIAGRDFKA
jgi:transcriptional regulator of acetoin/glycerol metabolism